MAASPQISDADFAAAAQKLSAPAPQEPAPQEQQAPALSDEQLLRAAAQQYEEESKSPLDRILPLSPANILGTFGTRELPQIAGTAGNIAITGAGLESGMLQGLSVDSVKALKPRLEWQAKEESDAIDRMVSKGTQSDPNFYAATQRLNALQDRIKEADNIIATGQTTGPGRVVGGALEQFGKNFDTGALTKKLEHYFPKQGFEQTPLGQLAQFGADGLTMGAIGAAFGPLASTAYVSSQMSDGVYQAKKEAGASDEDAERAAALTSMVTVPTMLTAGPTVDFLAKSFAGFSAKQGMQAIIKAGVPWGIRTVGGGAEFGVLDWEQKAVGQLQGYDPNRPLDGNFWKNFFIGAAFGAVHGFFANDPQMARIIKPDITTRNKDVTTPELPAAATTTPVTPTAEKVTPTTTVIGKPVPTENAEASLNNLADSVSGERVAGEGFQILPGGQPPQYTGPARPVREAAPTTEPARATLQLAAPQTREQPVVLAQAIERTGVNDTPSPFVDEDGNRVPWRNIPNGRAVERDDGKIFISGSHTVSSIQAGIQGPQGFEQKGNAASSGEVVNGIYYPFSREAQFRGTGLQTAVVDLNRAQPLTEDNFGGHSLLPKELTRQEVSVPSTEEIAKQGETTPVAELQAPAAELPEALKGLTDPVAKQRLETQLRYGGIKSVSDPETQRWILTGQNVTAERAEMIRTLVREGVPAEEADRRVMEVRSLEYGTLDRIRDDIARERAETTPVAPVFEAPKSDATTVLENHAKSLYTRKADRAEALDEWRRQAHRDVTGTEEGRALEDRAFAGDTAAATELNNRVTQQALANQGLGDPNRKVIGYDVSWVDASRPENDLGRNKTQTFANKREAQAHMKDLRSGPNAQIRIRARTEPQEQPWYEGYTGAEEPAASRIQNLGAEPVDRPVGLADVKAEVNDFQAKSGTHNNTVFVPNVEALPDHVKNGLTPAERASTAQIVTDHKLGNTYVIGDRFSSLLDLRRKLIEEVLPYRYRNVAKLETTYDPNNPDTGNYDPIKDRATLNLHAILRSADPYSEAARTALEEVNVHQGISKLLGNRYGINYVNAMKQVQAQFDRLGITDVLAGMKGYKNADEMAAAYKVPDWRKGGWQANKMTEELIGAYSRNFRTPEELAEKGPAWYQTALRRISNGIRSFLGLEVSPYDVQSLLHDSAAALREAKAGEPTQYHPSIGEAAKQDMANFRMANRPPAEGGGGGEFVDITAELGKARIAEAKAQLQPGYQLREQPQRVLFNQKRTTQEKLNFLRDWPLVMKHEGWVELMHTVGDLYRDTLGNDPATAIDFISNNRLEGARNPAIRELVGRKTTEAINALRASGNDDEANLLAAKLDRMNQISAADATSAARETAAQALIHKDGSTNVAEHKNALTDAQTTAVNNLDRQTPGVKDAINNGLDQVKDVTKEAADTLKNKAAKAVKKIQEKFGPPVPRGYYDKPAGADRQELGERTGTIVDQYHADLVKRIEDAIYKQNPGFTDADKPVLQRVWDTFRGNIQQIVRDRMPKEEKPERPKPDPVDTLRTIMNSHAYYKEAWAQTMDMLSQHNPELVARFNRALEEPVGETLANKLMTSQGVDPLDLIYNHFSTVDRLTSDLASKLSTLANIPPELAKTMTQHLQNMFGDIVRDEKADKLAAILKSVGGTQKPYRGELDHLVDHIVIGGLDSAEWLNHVAPRFGLEHITPEQISALRAGGDYLSYLRDMGMQNSAIAQEVRQQMGDIMKLSRDGLQTSKMTEQLRYIADVYTAGLLSGPMTHAPYFQQVMMTQFINTLALTFKEMGKMRGEGADAAKQQMFLGMFAGWFKGALWEEGHLGRGLKEFLPIMRKGIKPPDEFMPQRGDQPLYRGTLDKPAPFEGTPLQPVAEFYRNYRYVRNFLEAVSNLMIRGSQAATHHVLASKLAWEDGYRGQDAWDAAEKTVFGNPEQQARAISDAQNIVDDLKQQFPDRPVDRNYQRMLEGELLDRYKTTSENPDSSLADAESQKLRNLAERAYAPGVRGALRGDVAGAWGIVSRGILDFTGKYPALKFLVPFAKVPFNLVNEQLAWGPIGIWRSAADLVPDRGIGKVIRAVSSKEGIKGYLTAGAERGRAIPGIEAKIESGEISPEELHDLAWEQMIKGVVGTAATAALYGAVRTFLNNPNAPVRFTYAGPTSYGQQEIERGKGWQQNSVYLDPQYFGALGGWHSYENLPFRPVFAGIGSMSDYARYDKKPNEPWTSTDEAWLNARMMMGATASMFGSPLQGPETALSALTHVSSGKEAQRAVGDFVTQMIAAAATTPIGGTFTRQMWRLHDPTQYQGEDVWQKAARYIPVVSTFTLEPKLNVFGEHMKSDPLHSFPEYSPTGGFLGTGLGREVDPNDPVWHYLDTHPGLHLSMPGNTASVARIKMSPAEIYEFHKARGPVLKEFLAKAFADPHFAEIPEVRQNKIIKDVYERAANRAGQIAVMQYRREHPVDVERIRQARTARGMIESAETEAAMDRQPSPFAPAQ